MTDLPLQTPVCPAILQAMHWKGCCGHLPRIFNTSKNSDLVEKGETVAAVNDVPVKAAISGVIRGLLSGLEVKPGI